MTAGSLWANLSEMEVITCPAFGHVIAEKLDTAGFLEGEFRIQDEPGRRDDPVTPFFLDPGQPVEVFVGDILAQAFFRMSSPVSAMVWITRPVSSATSNTTGSVNRIFCQDDFAGYGTHLPVRHDDPVRQHIVQGRAEQDCGLAPGVSERFPPMVQAQADVGSVAKISPFSWAASLASWVMTPACTSMAKHLPSPTVSKGVTAPMRLSFPC